MGNVRLLVVLLLGIWLTIDMINGLNYGWDWIPQWVRLIPLGLVITIPIINVIESRNELEKRLQALEKRDKSE